MKEPDIVCSVRVPKSIYTRLKQMADEEDRTVAAVIRRALGAHLRAAAKEHESPMTL